MKNFVKFIGIIVLITVIGFSMAACKSTESKVTEEPSAPVSETLTITGLDEYNGSYIYAAGVVGETYIVAAVDVTANMGEQLTTGVLITDGSVKLPIWTITRESDEESGELIIEKTAYTGDINTVFEIMIWDGGEILNRFSEILYNGNISVATDAGARSSVFGADDDDAGGEGR